MEDNSILKELKDFAKTNPSIVPVNYRFIKKPEKTASPVVYRKIIWNNQILLKKVSKSFKPIIIH